MTDSLVRHVAPIGDARGAFCVTPRMAVVADSAGYLRFFPYETPFEGQREAMDRIYNALARRQDVLFEGACGTGKTLAALAPALEFARAEDKTVVITTNVHQQTRQFRREAEAIRESEPIRAVVFRGKGSMCHIDVDYEECQVLRDNTYDLVDREQDREDLRRRQEELLAAGQAGDEDASEARSAIMDELEAVEAEIEELADRATCEYFYRNLTADTDEFYRWLFDGVRTPAEIYDQAEEAGFCGYELLKDGLDGVDLVVCNYHHLLDPMIREQFYRWLDVDPADTIVVFDEAHNVPDAAREHATRELSERTLEGALEELSDRTGTAASAAANVLEAFLDALRETYDDALGFGERESIGDEWRDIAIDNDDRRDDLTLAFLETYTGRGIDDDLEAAETVGRDLDEQYETAYRNGEADQRRDSPTLTAAQFLRAWLDSGGDPGQYPVLSVRRDMGTDEVYGRAELYTCIPRDVTRDLFEGAYATVLMSATLRPFDVFGDVLGVENPVTMAYGLSFPEANRRTVAVDTPPLFASARDDPEVQAELTDALADAITFTAGNTLAFFPNYAEARRYHDRVADTVEATCYLDHPGEDATGLRERFVADDNGALFTSLWGTLTEGVSFDGTDARSVVVVGVPYPRLDDRTEAIQAAYDRVFEDRGINDPGWHYAVEVPTVRKTRQALGRVIRSPEDIGTRILLDRRYTAAGRSDLGAYSVYETLPEDLRAELVDVAPEKLKFALLNFYQSHDAYDGTPPAP